MNGEITGRMDETYEKTKEEELEFAAAVLARLLSDLAAELDEDHARRDARGSFDLSRLVALAAAHALLGCGIALNEKTEVKR